MRTIVDSFGRVWTVDGNVYRTEGIEIVAPGPWTDEQALERFDSMKPDTCP